MIAVCNTEDKSELLRNKGAWSALSFEPKNLRTIVNDVTKSKGVDVAFETLGEEVLKEALEWLVFTFINIKYCAIKLSNYV